jgi:DNA polymerase IV
LKLKTKDFQSLTRAASYEDATNLAHKIFEAANPLLKKETGKKIFRLLGVGISNLVERENSEEEKSLDASDVARTKAEMAIDKIRNKFGNAAVERGLAFKVRKD